VAVTEKQRSRLTPCDNVENQDDESENAASSRSLPVGALGGDGGSHAHRELEEEGEGDLEHVDGCVVVV
jgi:hypothetical protein